MKRTLLWAAASLLIATTLYSQNVNLTLRSNLKYPNDGLAGVWGHKDSTGKEYALVGASRGLSIVDVSNPANPVEVKKITGPNNTWREVRAFRKFVYVTTEGGSGLQIVDIRKLPSTANIPSKFWAPIINGDTLDNIHALEIDTAKKFLYLYGSNISSGGALAIDISDPWNPVYKGVHSAGSGNLRYIHDGTAVNDTLYGGHIYGGFFDVVDFRNKSNPIVLATQSTPNNFTHNTWLSVNHKVLFTTDETANSYLTAYDISNLSNITELDRVQSNPGSNSAVHNVYIKNDWAVTAYYRDGLVIFDAHRPQNLVQVANYDTHGPSGAGFSGAWGAYPYLPSGNILVTSGSDGLFVLGPTYVRACYLEGNVSDSLCGGPLNGVTITINTTSAKDISNISGDYKTGYHLPGTYSVTFSKSGYVTRTISNIPLTAGNIRTLNIKLYSDSLVNLSGNTKSQPSAPLAGTKVQIENTKNAYSFLSDASGNFSKCNVVQGTYNIYAAKWGFETKCLMNQTVSPSNNTLSYTLTPKIYDDFVLDLGWTVNGVTTGAWTRGVPKATTSSGSPANPGADVTGDCADKAYCTGINGSSSSDDDLDNGSTTLTSPVFDATIFIDPMVSYYRWFMNNGGSTTPNDSMIVRLTNGTTTVTLENITASDPNVSKWVQKTYRVKDYITPSPTMKIIFYAVDAGAGNIVEGAVDKFQAYEGPLGTMEYTAGKNLLAVYPNPFEEEITVRYALRQNPAVNARVLITDLMGRLVYAAALLQHSGELKINSNFDKGIYFVRIQNGDSLSDAVRVVKVN